VRKSVILGTHNHLPLGRSDGEAERLYQEAFKPFLAVLYRYPAFPVALHYSGILLEWLEEAHPEFLTLLAEMVGRGQVEVLGGGYFDPVLPLIPTNDKLGQLEKMTTWLRVRFETRPRGCWIAEKVWEPGLASVLKASGLDYTLLDDAQLTIAGVLADQLWEPLLTEDQGKIISVLPLSARFSELAATAAPESAIEFLRSVAESADLGALSPVAAIVEEGARAAETLLGNGWLEGFIKLTAENVDWLHPTTPSQYLKENPPVRRCYIPSSSSLDIMQWSLPRSQRGTYARMRSEHGGDPGGARFVVGGHFRNFLSRYPESWLMYSKMMNTHVLVNQVRGDKYKKKAAQTELWKGQSHYAYWNRGTGGIYENELRKAIYQSLIEAEKITRATEIFAPSILSVDFDMDNATEYLYQGSELNAYIHSVGGALFELDFLPASWNYLDTMVDREEEPNGAPARYQRKAFLDHFCTSECTLEDFRAERSREAGDFVQGPYEVVELNRALPELLLRRAGSVTVNGTARPVGIEKRFVFRPRSIDVYYRLVNLGSNELSARFGVEINVSLAARSTDCGRLFLLEEDRTIEFTSDPAELEGVQGLLIRDVRNEVSVTLSSARPFRCWSVPLETPCEAAGGRGGSAFQSHCFMQIWDLALQPGETWENHLSVGFEKTQSA